MAGDDFMLLQALPTTHQGSGSPRKVLGITGLELGVWQFRLKFGEYREAWTQ